MESGCDSRCVGMAPTVRLPEQFGRIRLRRHGQSDRLATPISAELPKWAAMSENSATRVLEDGQIRAFDDGRIPASDLRPLLAAMTAARDGDFTKVPETGTASWPTWSAAFNQIIDRSTHFNTEVQRVRRELVRHGRLDERLSASPGQGGWTTRVNDVNQLLDALVAPAANATRVLDAVAAATSPSGSTCTTATVNSEAI